MSVRRVALFSTVLMLVMMGSLVAVAWNGFHKAREVSSNENEVALPALVAMLEMRYDVAQIQQYLTDVSATGDAEGFDDSKAAYERALKQLDRIATLDRGLVAKVARVKDDLDKFNRLGIEMANAYINEGREAGNALMKRSGDGFDAQAENLTAQIDTIEKSVRARMSASASAAEEEIAQAQRISAVLGLVVCIAVIGAGYLGYRASIRILGGDPAYAVAVSRRVAQGNLAENVDVAPSDRTSLLAGMRDMQDSLRGIIREIDASATAVTAMAREIGEASSRVSGATDVQSDRVSSMAASMEQMAVSISQIADNASGAKQSAVEASALAENGKQAVAQAIAEIDSVSDAVLKTAESVKGLGDRSNEIAKIVDVIGEIADQTNLLALNAAIEAARAGEQGRGFAVVADEVRKLAERTSNSTQQIKATVDHVRGGTASAVDEISQGSARMLAGVELVRRAGDSMNRIREGIDKVLVATEGISLSLSEQDTAGQDIARNVESIAQMTEETSGVTQSVAASVASLESLAASMNESVRRFKL